MKRFSSIIIFAALCLLCTSGRRWIPKQPAAGGGGITQDGVVAHTTSHTSGVSTMSYTTAGANRVLYVTTIQVGTNATVTGVTYNGVALSQLWQNTAQSNTDNSSGWLLVAPDLGTHNIVATWSDNLGSSTGILVIANSWNGVHQTVPTGTIYPATGSSSTMTITVADAATGDVTLDGYSCYSDLPVETHTLQYKGAFGSYNHGCSQSHSATGSTAMGWTPDEYSWCGGAFALKPAP